MITLANIKMFFQPEYLFNTYPSYDMKFFAYFATLFGILIILGITFFISARKNKKKKYTTFILSSVYEWLLWIGIGGFFLLFSRYEGIPFISMRFLLLLWLILFVFWGLYILIFGRKEYRKMLKEYKQQEEKGKYLGKKKK